MLNLNKLIKQMVKIIIIKFCPTSNAKIDKIIGVKHIMRSIPILLFHTIETIKLVGVH